MEGPTLKFMITTTGRNRGTPAEVDDETDRVNQLVGGWSPDPTRTVHSFVMSIDGQTNWMVVAHVR
jgi:hypothetical protein